MKNKSGSKAFTPSSLKSITINNLNPTDYTFIKNYIAFKKKEIKEMCKNAGMNANVYQEDILLAMLIDGIYEEVRKDKKFAKEFDKFCDEKHTSIL